MPAESNQKDKPSDPHQKGNPSDPLGTHKLFLRKLLARPINLRRVHIFTLNYDTLIEQAADAEGIILLDGFVGTQRRVFRPEVYEQDIYFPGETTEGRVHRFDRLLHLYKLHGSITWISSEPTPKNPYGVESLSLSSSSAFSSFPSDEIFERCIDDSNPSEKQRLIYPTPAKYGETLGMPYAELFRRFAASVVRPQSVLFVIGYGFGDEHVNKIIWQALAIPSLILVIVDPSPSSPFVNMLLNQNDQRIWLFSGKDAGKFSSFVEQFLPELHADQIREKALETYRKLSGKF
ncbi:MAG: SIR2 family protein [Sandaracinaceae bacterium]|nr:SIR2 family protein [Sandaracinaceae bacterium]